MFLKTLIEKKKTFLIHFLLVLLKFWNWDIHIRSHYIVCQMTGCNCVGMTKGSNVFLNGGQNKINTT